MEDKIYFQPGEVVTLKQDIGNVPKMLVVKKVTTVFKNKDTDVLIGIKGRWFSTDGVMQEAIFNTKDLQKI